MNRYIDIVAAFMNGATEFNHDSVYIQTPECEIESMRAERFNRHRITLRELSSNTTGSKNDE